MGIIKTGTPPTLQKDLTISLTMIAFAGVPYEFYFDPRPEELTYTHPTRASVIQTLGGAWVDDFGEGIVDISLSGHTGWRANDQLLTSQPLHKNGMEKMFELRTAFFETFHKKRMTAAEQGIDPDTAVQMFFNDVLNAASWLVYPVSMQLRRHKNRPLLYQYQLRLLGLDPRLNGNDLINRPIDGINAIIGAIP